MIETTIDLLRHGEPVGGKRYRGQMDDPLSEKGWAEMRRAVDGHAPWQAIVSSPLTRCRAFAEELARRQGVPLTLEPDLKEIGFGEWEGRTAAELKAVDPEILMRFWTDPVHHRPAGAEPLEAFRDRVVAAWERLVERHAGGHLLVICHAGVIRMILRHLLDMPLERLFRIQVPSAGLSRVRVDRLGEYTLPRVLFHGGTL